MRANTLNLCLAFLLFAGCSDDGDPNRDAGADTGSAVDTTTTVDLAADSSGTAEAGAVDAGLTTACPVKGYKPCGGELKGPWTFVDLCPEDQKKADALFEHPYDNLTECKDRDKNFVNAKWERDGTMTFDGAKVHLKMKAAVKITYGFTDACLKAAKPKEATPKDACAAMEKPGKLSCVYTAGQGCTCKGTVKAPDDDTSSAYTVSENILTVGKDQATFCRSSGVLILDWKKHPISWRYWILKRGS